MIQFGATIQGLRTDNAKDFLNNNLSSFLTSVGIKHETSCPYTPQQNGLAERKIGDVVDKARTLLIHAHTPMNLWGFAVMTAVHLINRLPSQTLGYLSPLKLLEKFFPSVRLNTDLPYKIFGCVAYVRNPTHKHNKWSHKALKGVFLGYFTTQKGYKIYHPITREYMVSKDVVFDERTYYYNPDKHPTSRDLPNLQLLDTSPPNSLFQDASNDQNYSDISHSPPPLPLLELSISDNSSSPVDSSVLTRTEPEQTTDLSSPSDPSAVGIVPTEPISDSLPTTSDPLPTFPKFYERRRRIFSTAEMSEPQVQSQGDTGLLQEGGVTPLIDGSDVGWPIALRKGTRSCTKPKTFLLKNTDISIPRTPSEALTSFHWREAMHEEMKALLQNNTWEIVDLPKGKTPVGCRWVFSLKCKSDGSLDRHKARLVAQGYTQTYGIDYQETFAPVAKLNTIRILISLAVNFDWPLRQYDIKNAFLHGDLKEEIYMNILPGYGDSTMKGKVCKLKKALYGLKQSPRAWFGRFSQAMKALDFKQCNGEHTLFFKRSSEVLLTLLIVYVDDIVITGNDLAEIQSLERHLDQNFQVKRLGSLKYFLGIEFTRLGDEILMTQQKYVNDLLEETKHTQCRVSSTPIEVNHRLTLDDKDPKIEIASYQKLIGKLLYLSHTRPDICYTVNVLSQFMHSPRNSHFQAANQVLRYLKGTPGLGISYRKTGKIDLVLYTDSDFAGSRVDCRSTTGYCTFLGGNLVTWRSKKQSLISKSSTEAKFRAMSKGIDEVMWIRNLLDELKISYIKPIDICCDNKSAICIAHDPVYHDRMKHVNIDRFYIQDHLERGILKTEYVSSKDQCADIFTKGLPVKAMRHLTSKLGMQSIHSCA